MPEAPRGDTRADSTRGDYRAAKSDAAFRTISEVAADLNVPQHVLRFWETKFSQVRPLKRGGGRRYYRPEDVALLKRIRSLLYTDGMTIRGVQKLLRETGAKAPEEAQRETKAPEAPRAEAAREVAPAGPHLSRDEAKLLLTELSGLRDDLKKALAA
ncbi:MAG: MerR family transcriptional regulator [Rhodospirillaceae bacterium]|nr:MerR family transcriptional regulator [Rhodospirillaceae bacterium]